LLAIYKKNSAEGNAQNKTEGKSEANLGQVSPSL
jgi:hypothetical protein